MVCHYAVLNLNTFMKYFRRKKKVKFFVIKRIRRFKDNRWTTVFCFLGSLFIVSSGYAQKSTINDTTQYLTLSQCIAYALQHQPEIKRSLINESIAKTNNAINLSGWLPQVNVAANLTHYLQLPTTFNNSSGTPVAQQLGIVNTIVPGLGVTQAIYSPQLSYARKTAPLLVKEAQLITDSTKINIVSAVSKTFYNLLLVLQQINVLKEDTSRLTQNVMDTYHQYVGGIVDETDYDEATITLNNSKAQLKQANENIRPQYAALKQLMGYPPEKQFNINYDTVQMMKDIGFDTTQQLQYERRVEYRQLQTEKNLQHQLTIYYSHLFMPTLSGFFNYNYEFQNKSLAKVFTNAYPYSYIGLSFSIPVFTGFSRVLNERKSKLQEHLLDWSQADLKANIYSEYTSALATYNGNLYNYTILKENVALAQKVYFIVGLQYKQGTVAYLNVITAESNLITAQINYTNALYQLLSSKIDLEKAMGSITY